MDFGSLMGGAGESGAPTSKEFGRSQATATVDWGKDEETSKTTLWIIGGLAALALLVLLAVLIRK
jgi:hypothetical protein